MAEFVYLSSRDRIGKPPGDAVEARFSRTDLATRCIVRDEARGRFLVYESAAACVAAYARQVADAARRGAAPAVHEVIVGWKPQRLKFDVDAPAARLAALPPAVVAAGLRAGRRQPAIAPDPELDALVLELIGEEAMQDLQTQDLQTQELQTQEAREFSTDEAAEAVIHLVIEAVLKELASAYGAPAGAPAGAPPQAIAPSRADIAVSESSGMDRSKGAFKYSYHLLVLPYAVANHKEAALFTARVLDALPPSVRALVDAGVNKSTQNFRMELSAKPGSARVKRASAAAAARFGTAAGLGPADLLVTAGPGARVLPPLAANANANSNSHGKGAKANTGPAIGGAALQAVLDVVEQSGAAAGFRFVRARGTLLNFERVAPSFCRICGEVHHRDSSLFVTVSAGAAPAAGAGAAPAPAAAPPKPAEMVGPELARVVAHCHQAPGRRAELGAAWVPAAVLGSAPKRSAAERAAASRGAAERALNAHIAAVLTGAHDAHAAGASPFEGLPADRRTEYAEPAMRNYELAETLVVSAQMKLGKTKALRRYIDEFFADGAETPVIRIVSFRQTFSQALRKAFPDFALYSDAPAGEPLSCAAFPRLIVQVESLHRLAPPGRSEVVDLVVLDEVESVLAQFCSGLHRNFAAAFANFQWLLGNARFVIAMDANLSDRAWAALAEMRPAAPPRFHWNRFRRAAGDRYCFTTDLAAWLARLQAALAAGKRAVVPTNSLAEGRALEAEIRRAHPDRRVALYSSEMAPTERARHFADVHAHWGALDVLIYTPTCSAGVSFELAHFDILFGLFTDKSCDVETCRQMLGRVRNVGSREHHICLQAGRADLPATAADIRARLADKRGALFRDAAAGPFPALAFEYDAEGAPGFYSTKFFGVWLQTTRIENLSKNDFVRRFVDQVADSGAEVAPWADAHGAGAAWPAPAAAESAALAAAHRGVRADQRAAAAGAVAASADLSAEDAAGVRAALEGGADVAAELRAALEKWHLRGFYGWNGAVDAKFVAAYAAPAARRVYRNLKLTLAAPTTAEALAAATAAEAARYAAAVGGDFLQLQLQGGAALQLQGGAAEAEARDLLRDSAAYPAFGLTVALWMLRACGFDDFLDPMYVHAAELEARLRGALPGLAAHAPRVAAEYALRFGPRELARLRRESDPEEFIALALRCINGVARAAFGAQVSRIPAAEGGDAYFVAWSTVGALFRLIPPAKSNALELAFDRPTVVCHRVDDGADPLLPARGLFLARAHYTGAAEVEEAE